MASSVTTLCAHVKPVSKSKAINPSLCVRARSLKDEGWRRNIVDANLRVLRYRIEEVRMKERLERCCRGDQHGWYYQSGYNRKIRRDANISEFLDLVGLVSGTVGLTFLGGTLCLCLASLLVHLCQ